MSHTRGHLCLSLAILGFCCFCAAATKAQDQPATPEARAIAFLAVEVPKWAPEHKCFSCHNNGDAARALLAALKAGDLADRKPLADTLDFLRSPAKWDANGPDGPFKDTALQRVQFAAAAAAALDAGASVDRQVLLEAAGLVAEVQADDGEFVTDSIGNIGTPATYGKCLTAAMAIGTLAAADSQRFSDAILRGRQWLIRANAQNVLDAAATAWGLANVDIAGAADARRRCIELLKHAQATDGGWGPFVTTPPEVFDTAMVLLAMQAQPDSAKLAPWIERGRAFLVRQQLPDGSWLPTTRPSGNESYAQTLSTTGWATLALLATRP